MNFKPRHRYSNFLLAIVLLYATATFSLVFLNGNDERSVRILIRWSAKLSAILFSFAFSLGAIHYFLKTSWLAKLLKNRPHFGLAFAVSHTYHLAFLIWLQNLIHPVFSLAKTSSLLAGGLAYAFLYLMTITTFSKVKSKIEPVRWRLLHLIGGYWIWIIFFNSYLKNAMNEERYYGLLAMLTAVLLLRISHLIHRKIRP